jgi:rare lipoprotein A
VRPSSVRPAVIAGASILAGTGAAALPATASADTQGTGGTPSASIARVGVGTRHLDVRAGRRAVVHGTVRPRRAGMRARLQVRRPGGWKTLDRDRTGAHGRYRLGRRLTTPLSGHARVLVTGGGARIRRGVGRLNVYRYAQASWYGPGLYGNHLGCGGTLGYGTIGVANKSLPCGTRLTLRHGGRSLRVRVIDRGPYVGGREYDLTAATARRLGFHGHGALLTTR